MKQLFLLFIAFVLFSSHDMYLKLDTYFLSPNSSASIKLFNGTFENSENTIDRNRMIDVRLIGNGQTVSVDTTQWFEKDDVTILNFKTGEEGTWVAGVSTRPRNIQMAAADFNEYLQHDGVLDMLDWRKKNNTLNQDAVEKYSKHVKAIFQVGDQLTGDWQADLGYPIEFIPLNNPYDLHPGHEMHVRLLWQGTPLANQLVFIGSQELEHEHGHDHKHSAGAEHEHSHGHHAKNTDTHHHDLTPLRTDAEGKLAFKITHQGIWYLRTIYLIHSKEPGLTHESNWATLTFEIGEGHDHHHHGKDEHSHNEEGHIPSYVYWIGSLILFSGLFIWFNNKKG